MYKNFGFNENIISIIRGAEIGFEKLKSIEDGPTLDEWIRNNLESCGDELKGLTDREKYLFALGVAVEFISNFERMQACLG